MKMKMKKKTKWTMANTRPGYAVPGKHPPGRCKDCRDEEHGTYVMFFRLYHVLYALH
jgi:hypothetical protein